ncbi:MAG: hypothetical protein ACKO0M_05475 [Cyanobium sp.]
MTPLPDRVVVVALVASIALVFALVFWSVRLHPAPQEPLLWREAPAPLRQGSTTL